MWNKFKNVVHAAGVVDLVAVKCVGICSLMDGMPLTVSFVLAIFVIAMAVRVRDKVRTPSVEIREKRDVLRRLCASTYQLTGQWDGNSTDIMSVLNEAAFVFAEDQEVQEMLERLRSGGHETRDTPDLIRAMAKAVRSPVRHEDFERPFVRRGGESAQ